MSSPWLATCDVGLGTTYERWSLNRALERLRQQLGIRSVLEGPGDGISGIAGINSLILARGGARVTVVLRSQAQTDLARQIWAIHGCKDRVSFYVASDLELPILPNRFDLVWNFNVMPSLVNPSITLDSITAAAARYVLVVVPNRANYSFWLHRLHHRVAHQEWDHGPIHLLDPKPWQKMFEQRSFVVREVFLIDIPWWPDIVDRRQLIRDLIPFLSRWISRAKPGDGYMWAADNLPYLDPERYAHVHRHMERLSFIERSQWNWLKTRFAHHVGILAEKTNG